jgi:hypothetical protein
VLDAGLANENKRKKCRCMNIVVWLAVQAKKSYPAFRPQWRWIAHPAENQQE